MIIWVQVAGKPKQHLCIHIPAIINACMIFTFVSLTKQRYNGGRNTRLKQWRENLLSIPYFSGSQRLETTLAQWTLQCSTFSWDNTLFYNMVVNKNGEIGKYYKEKVAFNVGYVLSTQSVSNSIMCI